MAKNVVAAGLADRFEVEVAYGIGIARPISSRSSRSAPGKIPDERIQALIERHFDLRPASIIAALDLRRPIYRQTAAYGHFGRPDLDLPWERTDKAALLAAEAGLPEPEPVAARPGSAAPARRTGRAGRLLGDHPGDAAGLRRAAAAGARCASAAIWPTSRSASVTSSMTRRPRWSPA